MKKIYSSIMAVALFASALSCTSGGNTNDAGTQTAQTQALDSDGIPTGGEWITMFDGKTLNGWRGYCRQDVPQGWVVEDGSITYKGSDNKADTGFGDLIYDKKFKNFVFEIEWKIDKAGNSGIFYTAQEIEGTPIYYSSPEYQLLDNENMPDAWEGCDGNRQAGAVYDMIMPDPQPVKPYGNWNKTRIVVYNQRVIHYMNDVKVLEFQFGTNWSNYSWFVGDIFGAPLAIEGIIAFFLESTFVAVMFFGWGKVSPKFHLTATWLTAIGACISALWILAANAWMHCPVGMEFNPETMRNEMVSFSAIVTSPMAVYKFFHTVMSGWTLGGIFVVGVSCWMLLKRRNIEHCLRSIKVGAWIGTIGIVLTMATGDGSAVTVAEHQPMKLAAMEGLYDGNSGQDLVAIGVLNPEKKVGDNLDPYIFEISLPKGLSILANHDKDSFVPGINDIIAGRSFSTDGKPVNTISYSERMERGRKAQSALRQFGEAKRQGDTLAMSQLRIDIKKHFNFLG